MIFVFLGNVTLKGGDIANCNFIEIGDSILHGVIGMKDCTMTDCEFDNVTFLVDADLRKQFEVAGNGSPKFVPRPSK